MQSLAGIDATLSRAAGAKEVPGVVALAATDTGVLYEGAFGLRDVFDGPAMTRDSVFRIASMTKAVTSVAALQLVEQGKLQLDEPIGKVLPELAAPQLLEGFDSSGAPRLRPAKRPISYAVFCLKKKTARCGSRRHSPFLSIRSRESLSPILAKLQS